MHNNIKSSRHNMMVRYYSVTFVSCFMEYMLFSYLHNTNVVTLTHWVWWLVVPEMLHWPPSAWWWHVTAVPRPFSRSHQSCWTEGPGWRCTHGRPRCIPTTDHITSTMSAHVGHVLPDNFFLLYRNKCLEYQCLRHDNTF